MSKGLTPKQQAFVAEYIKDFNGKQAAIRAGYHPARAERTASELLAEGKVSEAVRAAIAERSQRTQIDADYVLRRLAEQDAADLADILNEDGSLKSVRDWPLVWRRGLVAGLKVVTVGNSDVGLGQVTEVKLADRVKLQELIGRHIEVGAWREKVEVTGKDGGPVQLDAAKLSAQALAEIMDAVDARGPDKR